MLEPLFVLGGMAVVLICAPAPAAMVQSKGRAGVFRDYRLRIAEVSRDYGMTSRDQALDDSRAVHD